LTGVPANEPRCEIRTREGALLVSVSGLWRLPAPPPDLQPVSEALGSASRVGFDASGLEDWDSTLVTFVYGVARDAFERGVTVDLGGLPEGVQKLVGLARAVPAHVEAHAQEDNAVSARVGAVALHAWGTAWDAIEFLGENVQAFGALLRGHARFRRPDLLHAFEATGVGALGIVALINFLIGTVLAFVGAVQLQQFGASIYVANLVAIGVTRELGPIMTGIVMAGRTGASFAAVLGTMTVNEEIDALRTMGLRPVEFLVLPRVVATALMLPALAAYADLMGMLGGMFVGVSMLDLGTIQYLNQTQESLPLRHVWIGLGKSVAFGLVVALTGCYYGIRCGRSSAAVGEATTKAVVMGIVLVVVVDALATFLFHLVRL